MGPYFRLLFISALLFLFLGLNEKSSGTEKTIEPAISHMAPDLFQKGIIPASAKELEHLFTHGWNVLSENPGSDTSPQICHESGGWRTSLRCARERVKQFGPDLPGNTYYRRCLPSGHDDPLLS